MFYIPCNPSHVIETYSVLFSFPKCVILEAPVRVQRHLKHRLFLMQKYVTVSGSKKSGLWPFRSITTKTHYLHAKYNGSYALPTIHSLNINWFWNQYWPQMPGSSTSLFIQRAKRKISRMTTKLGGTASSPTTREEIALQHCWYIIISFLISQSVSSTSKASLPRCCTCRRRRPKSYPCVSTGTRSMRDIHSCVDMIISHTGCFLLLRPKNALKSVSTLRKSQKLPP